MKIYQPSWSQFKRRLSLIGVMKPSEFVVSVVKDVDGKVCKIHAPTRIKRSDSKRGSKSAIKAVEHIGKLNNEVVWHNENGGEAFIYYSPNKGYHVDGYIPKLMTVIEYDGAIYHHNPLRRSLSHSHSDEIDPRGCMVCDREKDQAKKLKLMGLGYTVVTINEFEWRYFQKSLNKKDRRARNRTGVRDKFEMDEDMRKLTETLSRLSFKNNTPISSIISWLPKSIQDTMGKVRGGSEVETHIPDDNLFLKMQEGSQLLPIEKTISDPNEFKKFYGIGEKFIMEDWISAFKKPIVATQFFILNSLSKKSTVRESLKEMKNGYSKSDSPTPFRLNIRLKTVLTKKELYIAVMTGMEILKSIWGTCYLLWKAPDNPSPESTAPIFERIDVVESTAKIPKETIIKNLNSLISYFDLTFVFIKRIFNVKGSPQKCWTYKRWMGYINSILRKVFGVRLRIAGKRNSTEYVYLTHNEFFVLKNDRYVIRDTYLNPTIEE